ncbi:MAG: PAS domain-containing sensor histidine kinase [Chloroflexi bacterium]|nr:PAS domain-containing sensor histidine kinase [Chloroflexota bacterium]
MRHTVVQEVGFVRNWRSARCALIATRATWPYLLAAVTSLAALGISLLVGGSATDVPQLLFLGAVAVTAWYGGLWPGLLATLLGFVALDFFFELPAYSLEISDPRTLLESLAYLVIAILLGSLNAQLRGARARAEVSLAEARAAVRARDEALAAVSHDMRTPLTAIEATVAALEQADTALSQNSRQLLANIAAESRRLEHFITDALALSRVEAGVRPNRTLNAPGEVVSAILDRYLLALDGREISFDVPDTLPLVSFDASLLQQALGNLLDNVAAHTPPDTRVSITGRIDGRDQLRLEVADSGPGIVPADRERIFRKFERLNDQGAGAGLGLTLARAATEAQGGEIWVESSSLGGACFIICLPRAKGFTAADGP